ncbi:Oidioi.mRNA.OKI2018_I69.PAR.g8868.t1.cds [Oikopleura dioica]|uniref:Oidioi.mRNA.OKI2018_I69.PAR.g8868.t1.cds n=1 Tax=Oikopleura dioica TaxID=34765 RepID=A0ABN7RJ40_OIKDI|nr:Oidioi.mRNA.OKI2018_I69.PAR.g8868.t1.cds [Oikopleura dioica]
MYLFLQYFFKEQRLRFQDFLRYQYQEKYANITARVSIPQSRKRIIDILLSLLYFTIPKGSLSKSSSEKELLLPK